MKLKCFKCEIELDHSLFSPSKTNKSGYKGSCRSCINEGEREKRALGVGGCEERSRRYRERNPEKRAASLSKYNSSSKAKETQQRWRDSNREYLNKKNNCYYRDNKEKSLIHSKQYAERMKRATLRGFGTYSLLRSFQEKAKAMTNTTGIKHSVDHIIPLKGELVSGLHVPWNMRVITLDENLRKGSKWSHR